MMRVLFHANVDFPAWTALLAAALARQVDGFAADALVTLDAGTARALSEQPHFAFGAVEAISDREAGWITRTLPGGMIGLCETFGADVIRLSGLADREISGFATPHAVVAETPLKRLTRDPSRRDAYLQNLITHLDRKLEAGGYAAIIATSVQDAPGVALAMLAERRGVPFLSPKAIGFGQFTTLFDDARNMRPTFRARFEQVLAGSTAEDIAARQRGAGLLDTFRARPAPPDYMASPANMPFAYPRALDSAALAFRILTRRKPENLRYPYAASRLWHDWRRAFLARKLAKSPIFHPATALDGQRFLYFPLHYEPEASLLVSAPHMTDQLALIEKLHGSLPDDMLIAVKEHRPMLGRRKGEFYDRLNALPKLRLISPFADSFSLIKAAALTATITGSAGMESVLLGKPTLFFGDQPIQIIREGFRRAEPETAIADLIRWTLATPPARAVTLAAFLGAMAEEGLDFPTGEIWGSLASLPFARVAQHRQAVDRMAELLLQAIKRG